LNPSSKHEARKLSFESNNTEEQEKRREQNLYMCRIDQAFELTS